MVVPAPQMVEHGGEDDVKASLGLEESWRIGIEHVAEDELRLECLLISKILVAVLDEVFRNVCSSCVLGRSSIVHQLSDVLSKATSEIQKSLSILHALQNIRIDVCSTNRGEGEDEEADTTIRACFPCFVSLNSQYDQIEAQLLKITMRFTCATMSFSGTLAYSRRSSFASGRSSVIGSP